MFKNYCSVQRYIQRLAGVPVITLLKIRDCFVERTRMLKTTGVKGRAYTVGHGRDTFYVIARDKPSRLFARNQRHSWWLFAAVDA